MKNISKVRIDKLFKLRESQTRGHSHKIYKKHTRLNIMKYFFTQRVVNDWNQLPTEAVNAKSLVTFKTIINKEFEEGGLYMTQ